MSTGRVSSREAERATLRTVSTKRRARDVELVVAARLRQRREVLEPQRADVERRGAADVSSTSCSAARSSSVTLVGRQRADDVDEQARRQDDGALADDLALERDAQADLHVGGAQLDAAARRLELHAGQRLHGAAGGGRAGDGLQLGEERVAPGGELH